MQDTGAVYIGGKSRNEPDSQAAVCYRERTRRMTETVPENVCEGKEKEKMKAVTYLLRCADGTLYCGWTNDLSKRVKAHNQGKGAKYTKPRRPVTLVYYETFATKEEAMRREAAIKKLSRQEKLKLVERGTNSGSEG